MELNVARADGIERARERRLTPLLLHEARGDRLKIGEVREYSFAGAVRR